MAHIVAGIYEIERQIGSGGGGVVWLGRHLRLNKLVILKADKRSLTVKPETLRREVDMLKSLSHTYIPQVYDFVQEDGVVYTVMDFIDGESLDKILGRGQLPPQPQLIRWACQILEALCYLHSRPPHGILHADIKPANIMLRPGGDICLIDYNIALALGENGAVKVGYSSGYASPEHYGLDAGKNVMLDVRSDIYSLGATLYHLISGERPPQDGSLAKPLGRDVCSPAVAGIIRKAMAMDPEERYQSAEEMLAAFRKLHRRDPRMIRHKRRMCVTAAALTFLFLAGGSLAFIGLKQTENRQTALALSEYSAAELKKGNVTGAVELALRAIPDGGNVLEGPVTANAQKALTDALGVYELADRFRSLDTVNLPSAPYGVALSPDGSRFAALCQSGMEIYDTEGRTRLAVLEIADSALADAVFVDNGRILYAGDEGVALYDIDKGETLWIGDAATTLAVSGDGSAAAAVNRDEERAVWYELETGSILAERSFDGRRMETAFNDIFANPGGRLFALNDTGDMLAVSFSDGALLVLDRDDPAGDLVIYEESDYTRFEGGFCGELLAFTAAKSDQSLFGLVDCGEGVYAGELESRGQMHTRTEADGIWLSEGNLLVRFDGETLAETEMAFTDTQNIEGFAFGGGYTLAATDDGGFSIYDGGANRVYAETGTESRDFFALAGGRVVLAGRDTPSVRLLRPESHEDADLFSYDPRFEHDEARVSQDGETAMLYNYEKFRIYGRDGRLLSEGNFPDSDRIYDQQFQKAEESFLEVIWYDGMIRTYSARDGALLSETTGAPPDDTLYEEFLTERYRIASPLHGTPEVYDRETEKRIGSLDAKAYLTYATQAGELLVAEYVTAEGERYGRLLNERLETVAELPGLCDRNGETLIFDYGTGNLRQCRLYSLQELKALGETYMETYGREREE